MASTVLPNGIIIPEKYSRDWYADLYHNWQELDNLLGGGTPKDGTLTIQKNGTTVGTFSANQATNETVNIEVPDVNDATLTIQKNGTNVATFSANSSTNATANITVPTKTSDLTNDSGFITSDNTKIPLAGSNQISGDLIPATDNSIDIGSSTKNIKALYTKGITIDGTQFLPSDYVPRSGGAVMTGTTLSRNVDDSEFRIDGGSDWNKGGSVVVYGKDRSNENGKVVIHTADEGHQTNFSFYPDGYVALGSNFSFNTDVTFQIGSSAGLHTLIRYDGMVWSNSNQIYPASNLIMGLGSTSNKWKSFNGINPGALSLPGSTYINVDTTNWDLTCQNGLLGSFTPTADGWLMLSVDNSGTSEVNFWIIGGVIRINNKSTLNTSDNNNFNMITIPVEKDVTYNIYGNASEYVAGRSIAYCRFMPCRGNV